MSCSSLEQLFRKVILIRPRSGSTGRAKSASGGAQAPAHRTTMPAVQLPAIREGRVYLTDGNQYFNRPGPRLVDSLEILAEILHPDLFPATHRGTGWEPL